MSTMVMSVKLTNSWSSTSRVSFFYMIPRLHFFSQFYLGPPTERQRHLHVKAHLKVSPPNTIPTSALSVLHAYETRAIPAPMATYTRLITALFGTHSPVAYAQAWDLFTHMRYVAHPKPDALLYSHMIRACAFSPTAPSEPERALDLWTEMTVESRISPNAGAYSAIILACARSGSKIYVSEAFRLAKEMLDAHRDAEGESAFNLDQRTFCALLEGAKRVGDLTRTRWILAEMVRCSGTGAGGEYVDVRVNEEVMMHVFHAYASYKPPFKRSAAVLLDDEKEQAQLLPGLHTQQANDQSSVRPQSTVPVEDTQPNFAHLPPQSRSEVVAEAKTLFMRVIEDRDGSDSSCDAGYLGMLDKNFKNVQLTPRLLNSYLSVHHMHSSLRTAQELYETLFTDLGISRNAYSIVDALERCGSSRRSERTMALAFAEALWVDWDVLEDNWRKGTAGASAVDARMVEKAYAAMIRVLAL